MLLEEYGLQAEKAMRNGIFGAWLQAVEELDIAGDLVWMTGLPKSFGQPYDPDGYVIGNVEEAPAIRDHAVKMLQGGRNARDSLYPTGP
jgi:hypothetical protein